MTNNHEFNEIYNRYKNLIFKVAYKYTEDFEAAEDIMQEAFLALYKDMTDKKLSEEDYSNIRSWLYTTAKYRALNYKKKYKRVVLELDSDEDEETVRPELTTESVEEVYSEMLTEENRAALHEEVFTALMEKNPRWYEAVMLVCLLEMPQSEAAERMDMSVEAFYVMLHRARKWIKKKFGAEYEELSRL